MQIDGGNYIPLREAAQRSGYAEDYLRVMARGKRVKARKVGRDWFYEVNALDAYRAVSRFRKPRKVAVNE